MITRHAWSLEMPWALAELLAQAAKAGQVPWTTVALNERAYLGMTLYDTYVQLSDEDRIAFGRLSPTAARRMMPR
jgi:hypothetical protein